jgi:hypothetical protein
MFATNRRNAMKVLVGCPAFGLGMFAFESRDERSFSTPNLRTGDVFLIRNMDWCDPITGWYNHTAIVAGKAVIEAPYAEKPVRQTTLRAFYDAYPIIDVFRLTCAKAEDVAAMARHAASLIGKTHFAAPVGPGRAFSADALIRSCFVKGFGVDPGFVIPDDISTSKALRLIARKA